MDFRQAKRSERVRLPNTSIKEAEEKVLPDLPTSLLLEVEAHDVTILRIGEQTDTCCGGTEAKLPSLGQDTVVQEERAGKPSASVDEP